MTRAPESFLELADLLGYVGQVVNRGIPGAVWVRAELASVTDRRHLYLDVVQLQDGQEVAKARATLWARERYSLEGKFRRATGGGLRAGMKVLLYVTAEFHPQYGFSLHILDLSPEFTVGDQAIKLDNIRRLLDQEGLLERNRGLPPPTDFSRVAVVSPRQAAGLEDFRREADRLQRAGVTEFVYLPATFQGREAPASLLSALSAALLAHLEAPLDALVIIRGGGAQTDLAWLNDLELARMVARFPVPVITGIGHARDDSILDEVACIRSDTPSKAAAYVVNAVAAAAGAALADHRQIRALGQEALREAERAAAWVNDRALRAARGRLSSEAERLDRTMRGVVGLTPERTLGRGYALVRGVGGQVVTRAAQIGAGAPLRLEFVDGQVGVRAEP
ncbi:exodeoxyribonuclease VII large subunit [Deinococcus altitudinis]|uniref:exodeoxyribonuclease VII large subunit n=1 Tax=Deinococcus altitudinis TaxID=468914 RepID=UPI003892ABAA